MKPTLTINLLPKAPTKKRPMKLGLALPSLKGLPIILGVVVGGAILLITLVAVVTAGAMQGQLTRLTKEWEALAPQRQSFTTLQQQQQQGEARVAKLAQVVEQRIVWSQRLNRLSEVLPNDLWLSHLVIDAPFHLTVHGSALERSTGEGMQAVSQFVAALQRDAVFTSLFDKITLQSVKTRAISQTEVIDFTIECVASQPVS